jgi:hypothetical protein
MKNKIKYTDEPMGKLKVIKDFLPPVDNLDFNKANKHNKKIKTQLLKKKTADKIRTFRGKLKWTGNLDEMRTDK